MFTLSSWSGLFVGLRWCKEDIKLHCRRAHGLLWPHLQTSFPPPSASASISSWMVFKKRAVQLFTWLSCNATKGFEKKIWKLVLGCLRVFHSAGNKSQDKRQLQLPIFTTGDNWSSMETPDSKTWEKLLWSGNSQLAISSHSHPHAFLEDQCILGH